MSSVGLVGTTASITVLCEESLINVLFTSDFMVLFSEFILSPFHFYL